MRATILMLAALVAVAVVPLPAPAQTVEHVIEGARQILDAAGVADRCELVGGSFFDALPAGAHAYILRGIIPAWEDDQAVGILTNCGRAMAARARVLLVERLLVA
jgi:hypothetical protein